MKYAEERKQSKSERLAGRMSFSVFKVMGNTCLRVEQNADDDVVILTGSRGVYVCSRLRMGLARNNK